MKNKLLKTVLTTATVASVIAPIATLASCNKATNPVAPVDPITPEQEQLFDITDGKLNGFKSGVTDQQIKDYCKDGVLNLPAVKTIGADAFNASIKNANIPFGTTINISKDTATIGDKAFYGNSALSVTWSGSGSLAQVEIGESAFAFCSSLKSFQMAAGLFKGGTIKANAFVGCTALGSLDCSELAVADYGNVNFNNWAFGCLDGLGSKASPIIIKTAMPSDETAANQKLFGKNVWSRMAYAGLRPDFAVGPSSGTTFTNQYKYVPKEYFVVSSGALTGAKLAWTDDFNYVELPTDVTSIDITTTNLFSTKSNVVDWDLSTATGLTAIPAALLKDSQPAVSKTITLGSGITTIGANAFNNCNWTIALNDDGSSITTINDSAFYKSALTKFKFNAAMTTVGPNAFAECASLATLDLSNIASVPTSGWDTTAFNANTGTSSTNTLKLNETKKTTYPIDQWKLKVNMTTFLTNHGLSSSKWSFSEKYLPTMAQLFDVDTNGQLCGWAKDSTGVALTTAEVKTILADYDTPVTTLTLPDTVKSIKADAFWDSTNLVTTIPDSVTALDLSACTSLTTIGADAFRASTIKTITFSSSITSIGNYAFANLPLTDTTLSLPTALTSIGDYAFYQMPNTLTTINCQSGTALTTIGAYAFAQCLGLKTVTGFDNASGLTSIGQYAFYGDPIETLIIPSFTSITIGDYAFANTKIATINMKAYGTSAPTGWTVGTHSFDAISTSGKILVSGTPGTTFLSFFENYSDVIAEGSGTTWVEANS